MTATGERTLRGCLVDAFPAKLWMGRRISGPLRDRPIFVVGAGRSGTSALVEALARHPEVIGRPREAPVYDFVGKLAHQYEGGPHEGYYNQCSEIGRERAFAYLRRFVFETMWGEAWGYRILMRLRRARGRAFRRVNRWVAKAFLAEEAARGLLALYPAARFVYIHRSGIDVVKSRSRYRGFREGSFREHCETWAHYVRKYEYLRSWDRSIAVRQEDLAEAPGPLLARVFGFLELTADEAPARYSSRNLVHPLDTTDTKATDVASALRSRRPAWEEWSDEQRSLFVSVCGEGMRQLGYRIPFLEPAGEESGDQVERSRRPVSAEPREGETR